MGKRVLHVGCTDHPITAMKVENAHLLHAKLVKVAAEVVGLDIDKEGIEKLSELMPEHRFVHHDAEKLGESAQLSDESFDLVVAADVIEHIANPGLFVRGVTNLLAPGGRLILTTPHSFAVKRLIAMAAFGYEHVHPDHVSYYSLSTMSELLDRCDFKVDDFVMFQWFNPTFKNRFSNAVLMPLLWLSGGRLCDEIALSCSPMNA
jgi:2-polyprenyl-3-methyl-5-hydroxy-6-metoxy-1,4-benzoquinol methylase